jgi:hypothetical protein
MRNRIVVRSPKTSVLLGIIFILTLYAIGCSFSEKYAFAFLWLIWLIFRTEPNAEQDKPLIYKIKVVPPIFRNTAFGNEYTLQSIPYRNETVKEFRARYLETPSKDNAIFVLLPSYRDPLCNSTLVDMFRSCKHCENVFVGLVLQLNFEHDRDKLCVGLENSPHAKNIRVVYVSHKDALGPVYGRLLAAKLWQGEEYILGMHCCIA